MKLDKFRNSTDETGDFEEVNFKIQFEKCDSKIAGKTEKICKK